MKNDNTQKSLDFNNTENGFAYKSIQELRLSKILFTAMQSQKLVNFGTRVVLGMMKFKLPVNWLLKKTLFKQFVGGETLREVKSTLDLLSANKVQAILDYGAEGKESEQSFETAASEFLRLISFAAQTGKVPFISIKITALGSFDLLEKVNPYVYNKEKKLEIDIRALGPEETKAWQAVVNRVDAICRKAAEYGVGILIDAEESWIQDSINLISEMMMRTYNLERVVVFNTIQFYNKNSYPFLQRCIADAPAIGYQLGLKIVRGAYMEKERERANRLNYPCPIQVDKNATDDDFNKGLAYCLEHIDKLSLIIASHNEESNLLAVTLISEKKIDKKHPHIHFSQLYGMSDHITFNLAEIGYPVSKYLPYGPISDVMPYLMRRAQENTSVSGQTSRELSLIDIELKRRKKQVVF